MKLCKNCGKEIFPVIDKNNYDKIKWYHYGLELYCKTELQSLINRGEL
jgi:hypothetical protein